MNLVIVDYGVGNVRSISGAVAALGCSAKLSDSEDDIRGADALILPGVGAFHAAMDRLRELGLVETLTEAAMARKTPILGICLGLQLFAEWSEEGGRREGLNWLPAVVRQVEPGDGLPLPHVGWNDVHFVRSEPLFSGLEGEATFYFDHSFQIDCPPENVTAVAHYGREVVAAVHKDNLFGAQFHPEKSQRAGLAVLGNFIKAATC